MSSYPIEVVLTGNLGGMGLDAVQKLQDRIDGHALLGKACLRVIDLNLEPVRVVLQGQIDEPDRWHAMVRIAADKEEMICAYVGAELEKMVAGVNPLQPLLGVPGAHMIVEQGTVGDRIFANQGGTSK